VSDVNSLDEVAAAFSSAVVGSAVTAALEFQATRFDQFRELTVKELTECRAELQRATRVVEHAKQVQADQARTIEHLSKENEALKAELQNNPPVALQTYSFADINAALAKINKREPVKVSFDRELCEWLIGDGNQNSAASVVCCVLDYFLPKGPTA
jgi:hypothetical protein